MKNYENHWPSIDLPLTFHTVHTVCTLGRPARRKGWCPVPLGGRSAAAGPNWTSAVTSCDILWHPVASCGNGNVDPIYSPKYWQTKIESLRLRRSWKIFWKYSVSGAVHWQRSHPRPFLVFSLGDPTFQGEPGHKGPPALERGTPSLEVRWLRWPRWLKSCRHWSQQSPWHPVCSNSSRCRTLRLESCENSSPQL